MHRVHTMSLMQWLKYVSYLQCTEEHSSLDVHFQHSVYRSQVTWHDGMQHFAGSCKMCISDEAAACSMHALRSMLCGHE